eukprot:CAMPEP_0201921174 /NCGR_PEP_ID=MMETSP0903-20130614/9580_1 /ASSEMBLY_ACC=CAM_ASM_000552 /TAXON_ID=420261 /ORGANISM="Thalassiosira antarctica, Strain CCMP982" /LENGTH=305 /DNA_ID=CAMNT_0048458087 /DNA_START=115 /DNA_END=1032 /DNA_ORIENTATION=-
MSTADISQCAACGNKGGGDLKACTACKLVKYCSVTCQKAHRPRHKKQCKRRAAELFDEALFQEPPPKDDCPICFLPLWFGTENRIYQSCCGKFLCRGCFYAVEAERRKSRPNIPAHCPFCRTTAYTSNEEFLERCKKRMEANDVEAFITLAWHHHDGGMGLPQDFKKSMGLWLRAAELGSINAHYDLGRIYYDGNGVEKDMKKAEHYCERAAMGGNVIARHYLGLLEGIHKSNHNRAKKHIMIAARAGYDDSLGTIGNMFTAGHVTKEEYEETLRANKDSLDEMKSDQRDRTRAVDIFLKNNSSL